MPEAPKSLILSFGDIKLQLDGYDDVGAASRILRDYLIDLTAQDRARAGQQATTPSQDIHGETPLRWPAPAPIPSPRTAPMRLARTVMPAALPANPAFLEKLRQLRAAVAASGQGPLRAPASVHLPPETFTNDISDVNRPDVDRSDVRAGDVSTGDSPPEPPSAQATDLPGDGIPAPATPTGSVADTPDPAPQPDTDDTLSPPKASGPQEQERPSPPPADRPTFDTSGRPAPSAPQTQPQRQPEAQPLLRPAPRTGFDSSPAKDGTLERILREAENRISEPGMRDRRSTFAHLRAAASAKRASETPTRGHPETEEPESTAGHIDTSSERAQPRQTPTSDQATRPVSPDRSASQPPQQQPTRPGTPSADDIPPGTPGTSLLKPSGQAADPDGFARHVWRCGARGLPDLLEAAAAYVTLVEGRRGFSRPQLEVRVNALSPGIFTREDLLRAFGILLREGKIMRLGDGRYSITEATDFRPRTLG